jgi:hypothetical protein
MQRKDKDGQFQMMIRGNIIEIFIAEQMKRCV